MDSEIPVIAFSANSTKNVDAFVVVNTNLKDDKPIVVAVKGTNAKKFKAFRTGNNEKYTEIGEFAITSGEIVYSAPMNSATSFFAVY